MFTDETNYTKRTFELFPLNAQLVYQFNIFFDLWKKKKTSVWGAMSVTAMMIKGGRAQNDKRAWLFVG